jgi:hypothetical protein
VAARRGQRAQRQAGVQAAAEAGCGTRPLAPVTDPLTIASKDARSRRIRLRTGRDGACDPTEQKGAGAGCDADEPAQVEVSREVCGRQNRPHGSECRPRRAQRQSPRLHRRVLGGSPPCRPCCTTQFCQFSRRSVRQASAVTASTQAVARTLRTIAVLRICRPRRTAAGTCWRIRDRHRRKFRSSS